MLNDVYSDQGCQIIDLNCKKHLENCFAVYLFQDLASLFKEMTVFTMIEYIKKFVSLKLDHYDCFEVLVQGMKLDVNYQLTKQKILQIDNAS